MVSRGWYCDWYLTKQGLAAALAHAIDYESLSPAAVVLTLSYRSRLMANSGVEHRDCQLVDADSGLNWRVHGKFGRNWRLTRYLLVRSPSPHHHRYDSSSIDTTQFTGLPDWLIESQKHGEDGIILGIVGLCHGSYLLRVVHHHLIDVQRPLYLWSRR